jgi:hypothetical protein
VSAVLADVDPALDHFIISLDLTSLHSMSDHVGDRQRQISQAPPHGWILWQRSPTAAACHVNLIFVVKLMIDN